MTAISRIGGEWTPYPGGGGLAGAGHAFHGLTGSKTTTVTPGRTGGALFRGTRGATSSAAAVTCDTGLEPTEGVTLIGRTYFRINQHPAASGANGIPIFSINAFATAGFHVWLLNTGKLGWSHVIDTSAAEPDDFPDNPWVVPLDEWVMLEAAHSWSTTEEGRALIRVTTASDPPRVIFCRQHLPPSLALGTGSISYAAGMLADAGAGFVIDIDDLGLNTDEGTENNTWLGPGAVRTARPSADIAAAVPFDTGTRFSTARGMGGRTIPDHSIEPPDPFEACFPEMFCTALSKNPIVNPVAAGHCSYQDSMIVSAGADWHAHGPPLGPSTWAEDSPRIGAAGDTLEVECDASDQVGTVSFAAACMVIGKLNYGEALLPEPPQADRYLSLYTGNESPPISGDETDRATVNFGQYSQLVMPGVDGAWDGAVGRFQQFPALGAAPTLVFRREHDCAASEAIDGLEHHEWASLGAGIIYESGYEPQDPLPDCRQWVSLV